MYANLFYCLPIYCWNKPQPINLAINHLAIKLLTLLPGYSYL